MYREISKDLVAGADEVEYLAEPFDFIRIVSSPAGAVLTVLVDGQQKATLRPGMTWELQKAGSEILVKSSVTGTVVIGWALGDRIKDEPGGPGSGTTVIVSTIGTPVLQSNGVIDATTGGGAVDTLGTWVASKMRRLWVSLDPGAVNPVRLQGDNTAAASYGGVWLYPGEQIALQGWGLVGATATVYVYDPGIGGQRVAFAAEIEP